MQNKLPGFMTFTNTLAVTIYMKEISTAPILAINPGESALISIPTGSSLFYKVGSDPSTIETTSEMDLLFNYVGENSLIVGDRGGDNIVRLPDPFHEIVITYETVQQRNSATIEFFGSDTQIRFHVYARDENSEPLCAQLPGLLKKTKSSLLK